MDDAVDGFLEHYGVKGMHWGARKSSFSKNRALNKASKAKARAKEEREFDQLRRELRPSPKKKLSRAADIQRARDRIDTGAAAADRKAAKAKYRADKERIGSRAARDILRRTRADILRDEERSLEFKNGAEQVAHLLDSLARTMEDNRRQADELASFRSQASAARSTPSL